MSGARVDLSPRVFTTRTVAASPAAATETIVASVTISTGLAVSAGVLLMGFLAWTQGTDGVSYNVKLRKTDASGSTLKATGLPELAATKLGSAAIIGFDTSPSLPGQVYVMTLTITLGSAPSTVSAVELDAIVL